MREGVRGKIWTMCLSPLTPALSKLGALWARQEEGENRLTPFPKSGDNQKTRILNLKRET